MIRNALFLLAGNLSGRYPSRPPPASRKASAATIDDLR